MQYLLYLLRTDLFSFSTFDLSLPVSSPISWYYTKLVYLSITHPVVSLLPSNNLVCSISDNIYCLQTVHINFRWWPFLSLPTTTLNLTFTLTCMKYVKTHNDPFKMLNVAWMFFNKNISTQYFLSVKDSLNFFSVHYLYILFVEKATVVICMSNDLNFALKIRFCIVANAIFEARDIR